MMRLPARLTTKLAKTRIAQVFHSAPAGPLVHCVDAAEILHPGSAAPVSHERMQKLIENPSPVIWIGGSEPLVHPGIGHFVRVVAQSRRFVFLETNGIFLRQRIHEFQPLPELFLTVRLDSPQAPESGLSFEGLRAARLSGFFTVVRSLVCEDSDVGSLNTLRSLLLEKDVDGWLITAGCADEVVARKAIEARRLIPSSFWRQFSEHVEEALPAQTQYRELHPASASLVESPHTEACQESVRLV
jgi:hypothetical protein